MGWTETSLNEYRAGRTNGKITSYAPVTGQALGDVPIFDANAVRDAVSHARTAQKSWAQRSLEDRSNEMLRFRDGLVQHADELVTLLAREAGKPRVEGLIHEVLVAVDFVSYFAKRAPKILAPRDIDFHILKHRRGYIHYTPRGVIGIVSPWNYPLLIPLSDTITGLIAGNAVVLKPSEVTPLIALKCKEIFDASGLDPGLFQVVTGDAKTGTALIDAQPDKIVFTGAVNTGKKVAAACGEKLIPCTLELGGKAALIACADADIERTARAIVFGGFANSGQICISVERVYAHASIHDELVKRVLELTGSLRQGDPLDPDTDVGAIIFPHQIEVAEKLIADAVSKGAKIGIGGKRRSGGQFFEPTILLGCTQTMLAVQDEIFGPVIPIVSVKDEEQAIEFTNASHLGLVAYVFTKDRDKGRRLAEQIRVGVVMVNDVLSAYATPETPFGGFKNSGFGKVRGDEGLRDMCEARVVHYNRLPTLKRELWWYPYSARTYQAAQKALHLLFRGGSPVQKLLDLF